MDGKFRIKDMVILSMCAVVTFVSKIALAALPNIEMVTLLLILFACVFGIRAIYISIIYVILEIISSGLGFWVLGYIFLWPFLICVTNFLGKKMKESNLFRSIIAAIFGFCFDIFYTLIIMLFYGFWTGVTYFMSGIVFSTVHMVSNYFIMLFLGDRMYNLINNLHKQSKQSE